MKDKWKKWLPDEEKGCFLHLHAGLPGIKKEEMLPANMPC